MARTRFRNALIVASGVALAFGTVIAAGPFQDQPGSGKNPDKVWNQYVKANQPGEQHEFLKPLAGTWEATMTAVWPDVGEKQFTGTMTNTWVMGNKFLMQQYNGTTNGVPFTGLGYIGYSTTNKTFQCVWLDSVGTNIAYNEGQVDKFGSTFTFNGTETDPATGKKVDYKETIVVLNNDHHIFTRSYKNESGEYETGFWIDYTRRN